MAFCVNALSVENDADVKQVDLRAYGILYYCRNGHFSCLVLSVHPSPRQLEQKHQGALHTITCDY